MYRIMVESSFSAAHKLPAYKGKCSNLHGHNWVVEAYVGADALDEQGMVIDFGVLKQLLNELSRHFDHAFVNSIPPFDKIPPTAENLAKYFFDELTARISDDRIKVLMVRIRETDSNIAEYGLL